MREKILPPLVVLVGAGPGDPDLITRAGAEVLAMADAVLYDRLSPPELLGLCRPDCERIDVGKRADGPSVGQDAIIDLLIDRARPGRVVVRLKGGDPLIFGRGGEEADALRAEGICVRIVPGITAAVAAGAAAGIPLTDRRVGPSLAIATGHEDPTKADAQLDYAALARLDTVVFYMGVGRLDKITAALLAAGRDPETPAAMVQEVCLPDQQVVTAPLGEMPDRARAAGVEPPAVLIVGRTVGLRERVEWAWRLPLAGQTVLVTRSRSQTSRLAGQLRLWGAGTIEAPTIAIEPIQDPGPLDAAIGRASQFDWAVLTSPNGVEALASRLQAMQLDARALAGTQLAAIGPGTAEALAGIGLRADRIAQPHTTEALAAALDGEARGGRRFLLLRSNIAPPDLAETLTGAGGLVEDVPAYRTVRPDALPEAAVDALAGGKVDWITFTSSSTVENFLALADGIDLTATRLASIGPVTTATLRAAGLEPAVEAAPHTIDALVAAIVAEADKTDPKRR
jgi:uroporphyrinogen III methyltransferase/synthase